MYDVARVVDSVVKSNQKADQRVATCNKRKEIKTYCKKSPNQHASLLEHIPLLYSSIITFILNYNHLLFLP